MTIDGATKGMHEDLIDNLETIKRRRGQAITQGDVLVVEMAIQALRRRAHRIEVRNPSQFKGVTVEINGSQTKIQPGCFTAFDLSEGDARLAYWSALDDACEALNKMIRYGELPGNGCDQTAQNGGIIIAYNKLFELRACAESLKA